MICYSHDYCRCIILLFHLELCSGGSSLGSSNTFSHIISTLIPPEEVVDAFKKVWSSQTIQAAYRWRNKFQLHDSARYFLDSIDRICIEGYVATDDDILRARVVTTEPSRMEFVIQSQRYQMIDVGGQRGKREKWIHHFDNVTAVVFLISISEYDQCSGDPQHINRMEDSMELFEQTVNHRYFCSTTFIVFFNKYDLFLEKIKHKGIKGTFPDYDGSPHSAEESLRWMVNRYLRADKAYEHKREIYPHVTTATDTDLIKHVFANVQDLILRQICKDNMLC